MSSRPWNLLKCTVNEWLRHDATSLGASIAYYTLFSVSPLLVIAVAVAGMVFGRQAAQGHVFQELNDFLGPQGTATIQNMFQATRNAGRTGIATVISVIVLLVGASGVFIELRDALNTIWDVPKEKESGVKRAVRARLLIFAMVLGIGILLVASFVASTLAGTIARYALASVPGHMVILRAVDLLVSVGVMTVLFAGIYRVLPDADVSWGDVWIGAVATSVLFTAGKFAIGLYLSHSAVGSMYGAAGSVMVVLLWIYYSSLIFLLGAEFTHEYATRCGSQARTRAGAGSAVAGPRAAVRARSSPDQPKVRQPSRQQSSAKENETMASKESEIEYLNEQAEAAETAMKRTLAELKSIAARAAHPLPWIREYPRASAAVATAAGLAIGALVFRHYRNREEEPSRWQDVLAAVRGDGHRKRKEEPGKASTSESGGDLTKALMATVAGVVAGALKTALHSAVTAAVSTPAASSATQQEKPQEATSH